MRREIEGIYFEIIRGEIAGQDTEAIVNPSNEELSMQSGVSLAIKSGGGEEIEHEAMLKGPAKFGQAVITGAGSLKARVVIHVVCMTQDLETDFYLVASATKASLDIAERQGISSISLPAIGDGARGLSTEEIARAMMREAISHVRGRTSLNLIRFVLNDGWTESVFKRTMLELEGPE